MRRVAFDLRLPCAVLLLCAVLDPSLLLRGVNAWSTASSSSSAPTLSKLLQERAADIQQLRQAVPAAALLEAGYQPDNDSVPLLRHCIEATSSGTNDAAERLQRFQDTLAWRTGPGRPIWQAAQAAVSAATAASPSSSWDNDAVLRAAPHSAKIRKFLTPTNVLTTTLPNNDLLYCIRAGFIDDKGLMAQVSVDELVDFFLYVKEVHHLVANARSLQQDRLLTVVTANDLTKVPLVGGSSDFRQALSKSSKLATQHYPGLAGPTLLLNLPKLLAALVKLFTPLFPPAVNARLKFAESPAIAEASTLLDCTPNSGNRRTQLEKELEPLLNPSATSA